MNRLQCRKCFGVSLAEEWGALCRCPHCKRIGTGEPTSEPLRQPPGWHNLSPIHVVRWTHRKKGAE